MQGGGPEQPLPEIRKDSLTNLGQCLKVAKDLGPEAFPYRVGVSATSAFFKGAYDRVYAGLNKIEPPPGERDLEGYINIDAMRERTALLGVSDVGEVMVSQAVFQGSEVQALTGATMDRFQKFFNRMERARLPVGWRTFGVIHSHPTFDVINSLAFAAVGKVPKFGPIPATWSGGDFVSFLDMVSSSRYSTAGLISPVQLSLMVASKRTAELVRQPQRVVNMIVESTSELPGPAQQLKENLYKLLVKRPLSKREEILGALSATSLLPPYHLFDKLGIVMYTGNHLIRKNGEILLERFGSPTS